MSDGAVLVRMQLVNTPSTLAAPFDGQTVGFTTADHDQTIDILGTGTPVLHRHDLLVKLTTKNSADISKGLGGVAGVIEGEMRMPDILLDGSNSISSLISSGALQLVGATVWAVSIDDSSVIKQKLFQLYVSDYERDGGDLAIFLKSKLYFANRNVASQTAFIQKLTDPLDGSNPIDPTFADSSAANVAASQQAGIVFGARNISIKAANTVPVQKLAYYAKTSLYTGNLNGTSALAYNVSVNATVFNDPSASGRSYTAQACLRFDCRSTGVGDNTEVNRLYNQIQSFITAGYRIVVSDGSWFLDLQSFTPYNGYLNFDGASGDDVASNGSVMGIHNFASSTNCSSLWINVTDSSGAILYPQQTPSAGSISIYAVPTSIMVSADQVQVIGMVRNATVSPINGLQTYNSGSNFTAFYPGLASESAFVGCNSVAPLQLALDTNGLNGYPSGNHYNYAWGVQLDSGGNGNYTDASASGSLANMYTDPKNRWPGGTWPTQLRFHNSSMSGIKLTYMQIRPGLNAYDADFFCGESTFTCSVSLTQTGTNQPTIRALVAGFFQPAQVHSAQWFFNGPWPGTQTFSFSYTAQGNRSVPLWKAVVNNVSDINSQTSPNISEIDVSDGHPYPSVTTIVNFAEAFLWAFRKYSFSNLYPVVFPFFRQSNIQGLAQNGTNAIAVGGNLINIGWLSPTGRYPITWDGGTTFDPNVNGSLTLTDVVDSGNSTFTAFGFRTDKTNVSRAVVLTSNVISNSTTSDVNTTAESAQPRALTCYNGQVLYAQAYPTGYTHPPFSSAPTLTYQLKVVNTTTGTATTLTSPPSDTWMCASAQIDAGRNVIYAFGFTNGLYKIDVSTNTATQLYTPAALLTKIGFSGTLNVFSINYSSALDSLLIGATSSGDYDGSFLLNITTGNVTHLTSGWFGKPVNILDSTTTIAYSIGTLISGQSILRALNIQTNTETQVSIGYNYENNFYANLSSPLLILNGLIYYCATPTNISNIYTDFIMSLDPSTMTRTIYYSGYRAPKNNIPFDTIVSDGTSIYYGNFDSKKISKLTSVVPGTPWNESLILNGSGQDTAQGTGNGLSWPHAAFFDGVNYVVPVNNGGSDEVIAIKAPVDTSWTYFSSVSAPSVNGVYGNGSVWMVVGQGGAGAYSTAPKTTWTNVSICPSTIDLFGCLYVDHGTVKRWYAFGMYGAVYSCDVATAATVPSGPWVQRLTTNVGLQTFRRGYWNGTDIVLVGGYITAQYSSTWSDTKGALIYASNDGVNWVNRSPSTNLPLSSVTALDGLWLAGGATSPKVGDSNVQLIVSNSRFQGAESETNTGTSPIWTQLATPSPSSVVDRVRSQYLGGNNGFNPLTWSGLTMLNAGTFAVAFNPPDSSSSGTGGTEILPVDIITKVCQEWWGFAGETPAVVDGSNDTIQDDFPRLSLGGDEDLATGISIQYAPLGGSYMKTAYIQHTDEAYNVGVHPTSYYFSGWDSNNGTTNGLALWNLCRSAYLATGVMRTTSMSFDSVHDEDTLGALFTYIDADLGQRMKWICNRPQYLSIDVDGNTCPSATVFSCARYKSNRTMLNAQGITVPVQGLTTSVDHDYIAGTHNIQVALVPV